LQSEILKILDQNKGKLNIVEFPKFLNISLDILEK